MKKPEEILKTLSLEEKASLCCGKNFWETKDIPEKGIFSLRMNDGPNGLRVEKESGIMGQTCSFPSVCFPTGSSLGSSWNRDICKKVGASLGKEARKLGTNIVLGPAVNIKRSPLCGRNFEYISEDPFLSGEIGAAYSLGVRSEGVDVCPKHYAANNQESRRMTVDALVDERTLREIYLESFRRVVQKGQAGTLMCSYNSVNGEFASENSFLLTKILREEWGFKGIVISDWGAVYDRIKGIKAGLDLQMPGADLENEKKIVAAVKSGVLKKSQLDSLVLRILTYLDSYAELKKGLDSEAWDCEENRLVAKSAAIEGMVLLKNGVLPLSPQKKIALVGLMAEKPRYQGGGSAHIVPIKLDIPLDSISTRSKGDVFYASGYDEAGETTEALLLEAEKAAEAADVVVVFAGLPESYETEGLDRSHLRIPQGHELLIERMASLGKPVVVLLQNGSVVEMPWADKVDSILECWLAGETVGEATAEVLFGEAVPSGKLAETIPFRLEDNPSFTDFPGTKDRVSYGEGLFVGYRYYSKKKMAVRFPFGFGLSYTSFSYQAMELSCLSKSKDQSLEVKISLKNTGKRSGAEVVQIYLKSLDSQLQNPPFVLKGFDRVSLEPGEETTASVRIEPEDFAVFYDKTKSWIVEAGQYEIIAATSSLDHRLSKTLTILSDDVLEPLSSRSYLPEIEAFPSGKKIVQALMDLFPKAEGGDASAEFQKIMMQTMPMEKLGGMSEGVISPKGVANLIDFVNKNPLLEDFKVEDVIFPPEEENTSFLNSLFKRKKQQTRPSEEKIRLLLQSESSTKVLDELFGKDVLENSDFKKAVNLGFSFRKMQKFAPDVFTDEILDKMNHLLS